jgi:hypothetical protein
MVPLSSLHELAQTVLSCSELFDGGLTLYCRLPADSELRLILSALMLLDCLNLIDGMLGQLAGAPAGPSFVEAMEKSQVAGLPQLQVLAARLDQEQINSWRSVRKTAAAHVDSRLSISDVESQLRSISVDQLHHYAQMLRSGFLTACQADIRTSTFGAHGQPITGAIGVKPTDLVRPYRR